VTILADAPELQVLAQLASVAPSKVADAFNDPEHMFDHMSLDELHRLESASTRMGGVITEMARALAIYADVARRYLNSQKVEGD